MTVPNSKISEETVKPTREQYPTTPRNSYIENTLCRCKDSDIDIYCIASLE